MTMRFAPRKRRTGTGSMDSVRAGRALLVHPTGRLDPRSRQFASGLATDPDHTLVVVDLHAAAPRAEWEAVAGLLADDSGGGLRIVVGRGSPEETMRVSQWLADRLDRTVVAPDAAVLPAAGGGLFVPPDRGTGWYVLRPGRAPRADSRHFPRPAWETSAADLPWATSGTGTAEPVPGGVWLRHTRVEAGTLAAQRRQLVAGVHAGRPDLLTVVLGNPGLPGLPLGDIARFWDALPAHSRAMVRFVPFGQLAVPAGEIAGQALADLLDYPVAMFTGLPGAGAPGTEGHDVRVPVDGTSPGWRPFARALGHRPRLNACDPVEPPVLLAHRAPLDGLEPIGPGLYGYAQGTVLEVVQSGLWVRPADEPVDAEAVRGVPPRPEGGLIIHDAGPDAARMRRIATEVLRRLDAETGRMCRPVSASDACAAAERSRRTNAETPAPAPAVPDVTPPAASLATAPVPTAAPLLAAAPPFTGQPLPAATPTPTTASAPAPVPAAAPARVTAAVTTEQPLPAAVPAPARAEALGPAGRQLPVGGRLFTAPEAVTPAEATPAAPAVARTAPATARVVTSSRGLQDAHRTGPGTPVPTSAGTPAAAPALPGITPSGTAGPGIQRLGAAGSGTQHTDAAGSGTQHPGMPELDTRHLGAAGSGTRATPAGGSSEPRTNAPRLPVPTVEVLAPQTGPRTAAAPVVPNTPPTPPTGPDAPRVLAAGPLRAAVPPTPDVTPADDAAPRAVPGIRSVTAVGPDGSDDAEPLGGAAGEPTPNTAGASTASATPPLPEPEPAPAAVSATAARASAAPRIRLESSPAPATVGLPRPVTDTAVPPVGPVPAHKNPAPVLMASATAEPAPESLPPADAPEVPAAGADDATKPDGPEAPGPGPGPESAVRVQPVPAAAACAVPPERGIDQERAWLQRTLGAPFDAIAGSISRVLSELPGLRAESGRGGPEVLSDLVAVKLYLSGGAPSLDAGVTAGLPGPHVPLARCVAAGLRRLPSYRGPVRLGATLTPAEWEWYQGRRLVMEWGFCSGDAEPPPVGATTAGSPEAAGPAGPDEPPEGSGLVDFLVWSMTARRTELIVQDAADRVVFLPGTGFKVLRVTGGDRPAVLLRELSPSEISEDGRVSTRPVPLDTIALASLEKAERTRRPAKAGERKPLGHAPGLVISGTRGPDGPGEDTTQ
ncbi:hypothetical protein AB0945_00695 [Streptomyces sp. NPDC005474]|uniref:hypothetical protein n=1 Tax=Streptomyces sp. NPDC005474 TaxID=3154878 RepID=UPI0034549390